MRNIVYKPMQSILLVFLAVTSILMSSCQKETIGSPVITSIRAYNASPNDSLLSVGNPNTDPLLAGGTGSYVAIIGQNLQNALSIKFNGVEANFNNALFAPNSAVVPIPDIIFSTIDTTKLYTLEYVTTEGSTTFSFKLGPPLPVITAISDVFASPGDSIFLYGTDLVLVQSLSYGGATISSFKSNLRGTALGFIMPSPAPTSGQVLLTTKTGTTSIDIVATPTIFGVSNENANAGDSVYIYGTYLKGIQSFTFGGSEITSYKLSSKGNSLGFVLPSSVTAGPVSITTAFGSATTVYNVKDLVHGLIANMQWDLSTDVYGLQGWNGGKECTSSESLKSVHSWLVLTPDFPTNNTIFAVLTTKVLKPNEGAAGGWPPVYQLGFEEKPWIPTANLEDPVDNWALKFEINIPKPWNGGALNIVCSNNEFIYRWEPWQKSATTTAAYTTNGWTTVTIPLTEFRKTDLKLGKGRGVSIAKLSDLVTATGKTKCAIYMHNYGAEDTKTGFYGGFDNLRVVKIK